MMDEYHGECRRKACKTFKSFMDTQQAFSKAGEKGTDDSKGKMTPVKNDTGQHVDCPLDKEHLGRAGWSLLHTIAAYYPDEPEERDKKEMSSFLQSFSKVYPCPECAQDMQKDIAQDPPKLTDHQSFSRWLCDLHNKVNKKLGKSSFDCDKVDERWLYGPPDGSCG
ncbi:evr1_Alr domain-containing protein Alr [Brevipalpus obovatus]|uniref:evr1_Alr domain-containing protein Alr n=1 Tax=Brevipalpus obovatus TaxID=246614 RepID=UPI003D9EB1EF